MAAEAAGDGLLRIGATHTMSAVGLSQAQVATLEAVAAELEESSQEAERVAERYNRLLQELDAKNALLQQKDELIQELRDAEASDVAQFKEKHSQELRQLQRKYDDAVAQLADREGELQGAELDKAQLSQKVTLLTLRVEDLEEAAKRGGTDGDERLRRQGEQLEELRERNAALTDQLKGREGVLTELQGQMQRAEDDLREARRRAEAAERGRERAQQDIAFYRSTISAEMEKQAGAMAEANAKAKEAMQRLQQEQAKSAQLGGQLRSCELLREEGDLERSRLHEDIKRLRSELEASRRIEGELHLELRKLELVNSQRDSTCADLRRQLQERQRGIDTEREHVEQLADAVQAATERLRDINDEIDRQLSPGDWEEREADAPAAVLPDEVDRAARFRDQLEALVQMHDWERREQDARQAAEEEERVREIEDLERRMHDLQERLRRERDGAEGLRGLMRLAAEEEGARRALTEMEARELGVATAGVSAARAHFLQERLTGVEEFEVDQRADLEDHEGAEWALLLSLHDHSQRDAELRERDRMDREAAARVPRKRHNAYLGLEVSDGITIRSGSYRQRVGGMTQDGRLYDLQGVKVFAVAAAGPAQQAGIERDDVITEVNGGAVRSLADFRARAKLIHPGEAVKLTVYREGWAQEQPRTVQSLRVGEDEFSGGRRRTVVQPMQVAVPAGQAQLLINRADAAQRERQDRARRSEEQRQEVRRKHAQNRDKHLDPGACATLAGADKGPMSHAQFSDARAAAGAAGHHESPRPGGAPAPEGAAPAVARLRGAGDRSRRSPLRRGSAGRSQRPQQ
eukprot:TRINITY_DN44503_c0_g1_i1.p1 TRINITY_DN44503_c0_g1~~TRINITY_DN44503_c0_g1_i1.p1  ORF type:complete len:836 (+),score=358.85 TRINITY_DN44503_c0_g1_i1:86-2509(+)